MSLENEHLIGAGQIPMGPAGAGPAADRQVRDRMAGRPFTCARGGGVVTPTECKSRFLAGHKVCTYGSVCMIGSKAVLES